MRSPTILGPILALLALGGCNSTSGIDTMGVPRPSMEVTSSIGNVPRPAVAAPVDAATASNQDFAPSEAQEPAPQPQAAPAPRLRPVQAAALRVPSPAAKPAVQIQPVPLVEPEKPIVEQAVFHMAKVHGPKFRDADPVSFGSLSPKRYPVHGVDVSRWQGNINWQKLRAQGANFAYIKATDGGDHIDPKFRTNWNNAGEAGMRRGAYHFFYWCRTGAEQADWFIRNVPKSASALPPVIDVEYNHGSSCKKRPSRETVLKKMKTFMDKLEAHYGQRPIIYTAPDFYEDNLQGAFPNHAFWLRSTAAHPKKTYPDRQWVFWQYSGTGLSHGVKGEIDLNVFNGDPESWNRWLARTAG